MSHPKTLTLIAAALSALIPAATMLPANADSSASLAGRARIAGQMTPALAEAKLVSRLASTTTVPLTLTFNLRHPAELSELIGRLHDPADPLYGQYLTPTEFTARYSPTLADYNAVAAFARAQGLTVTGTSSNRLILNVAGPASRVEAAFGVRLNRYTAPDGRPFYAAAANPSLPRTLAAKLSSVVGLDNAAVWRCHSYALPAEDAPFVSPQQIGSGPGGGLTPANIKAAYGLNGTSADGTGQTLGLFQLDGYTTTDIRTYQSTFGLPAVPLQNVLVDGVTGLPGDGAIEVTLDIELQSAMAPHASKIIVYEGPNSGPGVIDTYNKIATDNLAKQISSSWGLYENYSNAAMLNAENTIFQQMAAQGQTIFAAAGDSGAYDNGSTLGVDDPASQPYVTGVGGTSLSLNTDGTYHSETTWNHGSPARGGGGGGISTVWTKPSYQSGLGVSATQRNVPDVSLDSDPGTGYAIAYHGGWVLVGGTSCAAPLWAGFTALVNQQRAANNLSPLGFANVPLYQIGKGATYAQTFHDIADGSTNLKYSATAGYDDATGWGSFNGAGLLVALSGGNTQTVPLPTAPASLTATSDNAKVTLTWPSVTMAATYNLYRGTSSGGEGSTPYHSGLASPNYSDTAVVNGTRYYYKVAAVNSAGTSPVSPEASAVPQLPIALASLTLAPSIVGGGTSATGTLTLVNPAPTGGTVITLTSNNAAATVPATVTVAAGAKTATLTVTTQTVTSEVSATLSAAINSTTKTATLTIQPILGKFTVDPATVGGGGTVTGTLSLGVAAPVGGTVVTLSSNSPSATVPATLTVPAGKTSLAFTITTTAPTADAAVTLSATAAGQTKTASLLVKAPVLTAVNLSPEKLSSGATSTGTVTLSSAAPTGGVTVTLTSSDPAATVPANVTVIAGAKTATFTVTTTAVTHSTSATLTAVYHSVSKTATLTVQPILLSALTVAPNNLNGGAATTGTLTLSSAAASSGTVITLTSSAPSATVPASVIVPAGKTTVTFPITTTAVSTGTLVTITATLGTVTKTALLGVQAPAIAAIAITPQGIVGGNSASGTVTLTSLAPVGGSVVTLSSGTGITVPPTVTVLAGAKTATFLVTTSVVTTATSVPVTASANGSVKTYVSLRTTH